MAQIQPIDIVAPGGKGLNTERGNALLGPEWATVALNCVINRAGRIAARKGWQDQTTTGIAAATKIEVLFDYVNKDGTSSILSCAGTKIYKNLDDYTDSANDITSSTAPTLPNWQFINFDGYVIGHQKGEAPIARTTGDFADISYTSGTGPTSGNAAVAAFGRVWSVHSDLQTIYYSVLLDHTDYTTANGGGTINMSSVWTNGMDEVVAIAVIGANLVVFGRNHIVLWGDGSGSQIGIAPVNMHVVDTIEGTGCVARDSVQSTGEGDLLFLSRHGVQSLGRVIKEKSNPLTTLSHNIRAEMLEAIDAERSVSSDFVSVRSAHSPETGLYLLSFPASDVIYAFDTHHPFPDEDGQVRFPVTKWDVGGDIGGILSASDGELYLGSSGVTGKYTGNLDNNVVYEFDYSSGWLNFGELNHKLKFLKELTSTLVVGTGTVTYYWEWDFEGAILTRDHSYTADTEAEFNIAEFNVGEFSGQFQLTRNTLPAHGEGQFLRLGATASINGFDLVLQALSVAPKIGRSIT